MKEGVVGCVWAGLKPPLQIKGSQADHVPDHGAGFHQLLWICCDGENCAASIETVDLHLIFCLIMGEFR